METVRKLVKEFSSVRASAIGTSVVWGASKCSGAGAGRGGGGIDMLTREVASVVFEYGR